MTSYVQDKNALHKNLILIFFADLKFTNPQKMSTQPKEKKYRYMSQAYLGCRCSQTFQMIIKSLKQAPKYMVFCYIKKKSLYQKVLIYKQMNERNVMPCHAVPCHAAL